MVSIPKADSLSALLTRIFVVLLLPSTEECDREMWLSARPELAKASPSSAKASASELKVDKGSLGGGGVLGSAAKASPPKRESRNDSASDLSASSTAGPAA